jgi:hypothetical protein
MDDSEYQIFLENLDKAENGPVVEETDWDRSYINETVRDIIESHDIQWDRQTAPIVPSDDILADRLFKAGFEMALRTGVYCLDTRRQMTWSEDELRSFISKGYTADKSGDEFKERKLNIRLPADPKRVQFSGGPIGVSTPEELYVPYLESYARETLMDSLVPPTLLTTRGRPIRAGSPWEAVAGWQEAQLSREVLRRVSRPGLRVAGVNIATTEIGELAGTTYGGYEPSDGHFVVFISELKTAYHQLTKVAHYLHTECYSTPYFNPMFGGFLGGGNGVAIGIVTGVILARACYLGHYIDIGPTHIHLDCSTHPEIIRAMSIAIQALSRNTDIATSAFVRPSAGPGTKLVFYEAGALAVASVASGVSGVAGVQSARGNHELHATPLEAHFTAQMTHAAEGMTRAHANEIVSKLIEKYAETQHEQHIGESFTELYNLETLIPVGAWQRMYDDVCGEMKSEFGLSLED